jgi:outer membrane protein
MKRVLILYLFSITFLSVNSQIFNGDLLFKYAQENSPKLQNAKLDVYLSDEKIKEIRASGLPKINGELSFQNFINVPTTVVPANAFNPTAPKDELIGLSFGTPFNANYNLKLSQLIFSFSYIYALKAAQNYRELSRLAKLQVNENFLEQINLNLGQIILIKKQKKLLNQNIKEVQVLKTKTNSLISAGVMEQSSVNDIAIMEIEFKNTLELLKSNEQLAILNLKTSIGYPVDSSIALIEDFEMASKTLLNNPTLNPSNSSAVKMGQQNVILNELSLKASQSDGYPSIYGFFNQQHMAMRNNFNFFDTSKDWYPATLWGINVTIPLYNSGEGKAKNKQKEFEIEKAKNELVEIENQIASLYEMLKNNYQNAALNLNSQKTKVDLIKKVYQNEEKKLSHGASNSLLLSQRKIQLLQANQDLIQKEYELYKAEVQLNTHINSLKL